MPPVKLQILRLRLRNLANGALTFYGGSTRAFIERVKSSVHVGISYVCNDT
jgi:hypothetical protein